ncbi:MAG: RNA pseudouridine synthase [Alphaproteobacteria bacterium]|nr:RNA pseudouridine synthase [Alphaproteobacteria bacterium]
MTPDEIQARVLHRDGLVLVLDKPAGLAVHGGSPNADDFERHFGALRFGLPHAPALAHRLDRDTSGCLVLGRHRKALAKLGRLFAEGRVEKVYWAVVAGGPTAEEGRVDLALTKETRKGDWRMIADPAGQTAVTDWRVLGRGGGLCWIECRPRTGRTHQIRAHLTSLGCPILGDPLYGGEAGLPLHLHARSVALPLKAGKPPLVVTAPPPAHMKAALAACGWSGE